MIILGTNSIKDTGFDVANSLRFDEASTTFLSKASFGTPTSTKKSTVSFWCKRSLIEEGIIFMNDSATFPIAKIYFDSTHRFSYIEFDPSIYLQKTTNAFFRDLSAWSHFVVAVDMTQSSADNRIKIYHNGTQITSFAQSTVPAQDSNVIINNSLRTGIGGTGSAGGDGFEGYIAELVRIDGQALAPDQFGEFDEDSGIWKPIDVSGLTFGTNGFYLDFKNSSELGTDVSGNSNTFSENNITALDQSTDTCTNNFSTYNPLMVTQSASIPAFSEGNLKATFNNAGLSLFALSTFAVSSGKWFAEFKMTNITGGTDNYVGIVTTEANFAAESAPIVAGTIYRGSGQKGINGSYSSYGASYATGDIIGLALNCDDNEVVFYKNGSSQGAISITANTTYFMWTSDYDSKVIEANFGSPAYAISSGNTDGDGFGNFEYAVPSNHFALCTKNLAEYG